VGIADRIWTRERARREGVSRGRLTAGQEFVRVLPGYYVKACWGDDLLTRCAVVTRAVPGSVVSHWTALQLARLPVPLTSDDAIHVSVPAELQPRRVGVVVHRLDDPPAPVPGPVPRSGPGRAWCDAAALAAGADPASGDLGDLVATADALLRRSPRTLEPVLAHLAGCPGGRGVDLARRALALVDGAAESAQESRLRVELVRAGLPRPVSQFEVWRGGRFVARLDLAYPDRRVAVEYDGDHHRRDPRQWRRDIERRERLEAMGWRVIVVTANDLRRPDRVVQRVAAALRQAAPAA
jgi:very-short-patch-repair endonuclease